MDQDKLTRVRIQGMRTLADVELDLTRGLTVLIGDNGSGKSTIIEAFELLRQVPRPGQYVTDVIGGLHGGLASLLRQGADALDISVRMENSDGPLQYGFSLGLSNGMPEVRSEWWRDDPDLNLEDAELIGHLYRNLRTPDTGGLNLPGIPNRPDVARWPTPSPSSLAVAQHGIQDHWVPRLLSMLERIEVHPGLDTRPTWLLANQQQQLASARAPQMLHAVDRLDRTGTHLVSCMQALRNDAERWERVLMRARAGISPDLRDIRIEVSTQGQAWISVVFGSLPEPLPLSSMSEGQVAYLCFIALAELDVTRSVVVIDEPESHLHPGLLARVAWMLEELAETTPVVVATHSERFLDALSKPADSVVLCELDEHGATQLRRPDPGALAEWMTDYRGLGQLRSEGFEQLVFARPAAEAAAK